MSKRTNLDKITLRNVPFKNPSGKIVCRITGRCVGNKVEKNFPSHGEAEAFMHELIEAATQGKSAPIKRTGA